MDIDISSQTEEYTDQIYNNSKKSTVCVHFYRMEPQQKLKRDSAQV
jgi:hypothetical protein